MSFRLKLLVATMLVVVGVTSAALVATQQTVDRAYTRLFHERFEDQVRLLGKLQEARLAAVRPRLLDVSRSLRLLAVLEAEVPARAAEPDPGAAAGNAHDEHRDASAADTRRVYQTVKDQLLDLLTGDPPPVFRVIDRNGAVLQPSPDAMGGLVSGEGGPWEDVVASIARRVTPDDPQRVGYLALDMGVDGGRGGGRGLYEFVITKIADRFTRRDHGALVIGFPVKEFGEPDARTASEVRSGIWHAGRIYSQSIPAEVRPALATQIAGRRDDGSFSFDVDGAPHRVFRHALYDDSSFPPSYQVALYSLAELRDQQRSLAWRIVAVGALGLVLALALTLVVTQRLSVPIRELAGATEKIAGGDLDAKVPVRSADETGRLAAAFNDMVDGLALKERYRSVLDMVADKTVAQRLVDGQLALGGEVRDVTILFCDIRGFTTLTEELTPSETITLLNEHMTALTALVHAHGGVIDKFIGDGLMALFGAPQASDEHAGRAVAAAAAMVATRQRLNQTSRQPIAIGIGIASGSVVAGCVGAADRLNYTVVGGQVNLAARLCAQASAMEILIDDTTRRQLRPTISVEAIPALLLKGFSAPVAAYKVTSPIAFATAS